MTEPCKVEKLMSISRAEFLASLVHIAGVRETENGMWVVPLDADGSATITFNKQASVQLGGLLELPRARITIRLDGGSAEARATFFQRFDMAFQRGGG